MQEQELINVLELYNIELKRLCPEINIQGSPERTMFRTVIEDTKNNLWIMEEISDNKYNTKLNIAKTLEFLQDMPEVQPYLKNKNKESITKHNNKFWMVIQYFKGIELKRPEYINDSWRGEALADFLIRFKEKKENIDFFDKNNIFSIKEYVYESMKKFEDNKKIADKLKPIVKHLEKEFMSIHDSLPITFCHGDYHPLKDKNLLLWPSFTARTALYVNFIEATTC